MVGKVRLFAASGRRVMVVDALRPGHPRPSRSCPTKLKLALLPGAAWSRMSHVDADQARRRVAELDWWHTIEVAPGLLTPGGWDLRTTAMRLPWPRSLAGKRCLDVGTMDGFW